MIDIKCEASFSLKITEKCYKYLWMGLYPLPEFSHLDLDQNSENYFKYL